MTLKDLIYQRLTTNTALTDALGGDIYPVEIGQLANYPALAFYIVSSGEDNTKDNESCLTTYRIQFDIYDFTAESVDTIEKLLKTAIDNYQQVQIDNIWLDIITKGSEQDLSDSLDEVRLHRKSVDYMVRAKID